MDVESTPLCLPGRLPSRNHARRQFDFEPLATAADPFHMGNRLFCGSDSDFSLEVIER